MYEINYFCVQSVWVFTIVAYLWLSIVNAHADLLLKFYLVLTVKFCKKSIEIYTKGEFKIMALFHSWQDWGVTEQHNAMVFDAETVELADGNETTKVQ